MNETGEAVEEASDWQETMEMLEEMTQHPIDFNQATREQLEQLPFLSTQQVMDLIEYRERYGALLSMGELKMIRSLDYRQIQLLPYFIYIGEKKEPDYYPSLSTIARYGKHDLSATARIPFYERKGDQNGYLGYRYKHNLRYEFKYGNYVRAGLVGAQDAGEPFFAHRNKWGYDAYAYYLEVRNLKCIETAIVGQYRLSTGMGLVLNNSFTLGKVAVLQNLGRTTRTIRPHTSGATSDRFQGAAVNIRLNQHLTCAAFISSVPLDATLNDDGSAATLLTTSYHRTEMEMEKKHNVEEQMLGVHTSYHYEALRLGATMAYTHLNKTLNPNTTTLYKRYAAKGRNFVNTSVDYGYTHYRFSFHGETALNEQGAVATINTLNYQPEASWSMMLLQRFYSYRYTSLHGHAFSEGGHTQNESGIYLGAKWQPFTQLQLQGYADFSYFPWARYRVSQSSNARDFLSEAIYSPTRRLTIKGRYRLHLREQDNQAKTALNSSNEHRARLSTTYAATNKWNMTAQADMIRVAKDGTENGYMLTLRTEWKHRWLTTCLQGGYFNTDSYDCRLYAYERQLPHQYAIPSFYGRGLHLNVYIHTQVSSHLQFNMKLSHTHYNDRKVIGSGLQQIDTNRQTELDLQLRYTL